MRSVENTGFSDKRIGDPGRIRTCDLQLRRLLLYPLSYGAVNRRAYTEFCFKMPCKNAR